MNRISLICFALLACGNPVEGLPDETASSSEELRLAKGWFRIGLRKEGYVVTSLSSQQTMVVDQLSVTDPDLDDATWKVALGAVDELVVYGRALAIRRFEVAGAWRALPGQPLDSTKHLYQPTELNIQCFTTPCPNLELAALDGSGDLRVETYSLILPPNVDVAWLRARVRDGRALLGGSQSTKLSFDASTVLLRLPEMSACGLIRPPPCGKGETQSYTRDTDRCVYFSACVKEAQACPLRLIGCTKGYVTNAWTGADGCEDYACDPEWVVP